MRVFPDWLVSYAIPDRRSPFEAEVQGIGAVASTHTRGSVELTLKSTYSSFTVQIPALVIPAITSRTPTVRVDVNQWRHLDGLELADIHFGTPGAVDILVGADTWGRIVEGAIVRGRPDEPYAQQTHFGWVVFGPATVSRSPAPTTLAFSTRLRDDETVLAELLKKFFGAEDNSLPDCDIEEECARMFTATHSRTPNGRYVVQLLFRHDATQLGESYPQALRQFNRLERRLSADPELREKYVTFMREYAELGHMERIDQLDDHTDSYYIPHHAVTSKFRVVFNASARTSNGLSLNDIQLVGPTIQDTLTHIIYRFRQYPVALTADIEKMFRQILIAPEHRDYQRILWREAPSQELGIYRLTTVTYGMACSPYNAVRALNQCAHDNFHIIPDSKLAAESRDAILNSFYVDDFLTSCDDDEQAIRLASNVSTVLAAAQFKLRKWHTNSSRVLEFLNGNRSTIKGCNISQPIASVLGLRWDPATDDLFFHVQLKDPWPPPTKRHVLSEVARLFDSTGLLAPVVISGKLLIQRMWSAGVDWDAPLPRDLHEEWCTYRCQLEILNQVRVPRWVGMRRSHQTTLYGFCDASSRAYAAVIYTKTVLAEDDVRVSLLTARTKVAPLKGATIPRLELCAALLLANILQEVRVSLTLTDTPYYLWSDSAIVLCWLKKQPTTLKPYVANRVRQIQELTLSDCWHHVRSTQNPADCASRGITPDDLLTHPLWWSGPAWMVEDPTDLAHTTFNLSEGEADVISGEQRFSTCTAAVAATPSLDTRRPDGQVIPLVDRFSSIQRLLRTVAIILRWTPTRRHLRQTVVGARELEDATRSLIRLEQHTAFTSDIKRLVSGVGPLQTSRLSSLNPYVDSEGILRVGGRIGQAALPYDQRFPIILPKSSSFVHLLIRQTHDRTLHGGVQLMLQTLRNRYWILNARQAVKSYIHRCVVCRRQRGAALSQQMAGLPKQRVNASRPFIASGVDYCGPFILRVGNKRSRSTIKTYLAIFVCMAIKAVHIEVVDDLSSQAFLDAFTRFVSRRGPCLNLYSDNATAFVGANRLLQEDLKAWQSETNQQSLADMGTHWHFITPRAPHQGGLWEAAVKSAKHHLLRCVGAQTMWPSQLHTLATRIEACLNSRPITPLYDDPEDKFALTPGDFLIGAPLIAVPEPDLRQIPSNRLKQWQWLRQVHQQFWQRWSDEYLTTLQTRSKWRTRNADTKVGDIVLVRQENLPPNQWLMGRVVAVHPGSDGAVRNVTLQTATGLSTRAVQKLCLLVEPEHFESGDSTGQDV